MAIATPAGILTVNEPPSSYIDEQGNLTGFSVDVVHEIQRRVGNTLPITIVPEVRALRVGAQRPNTVLFSFSRTPERETQFHWITPLMRKPWVLYSRHDSSLEIDNLQQAKKVKSIAVVRGDVRAHYLQQLGFTNLVLVKNHEHAVKMLLRKRVDMIFYEPQGIAYVCNNLGIPLHEFREALRATSSQVYLMISKAGTDLAFVKQWRDAANTMKQDGTFQHIAEKWSQIIRQKIGIKTEFGNDVLNF